MTIPMAQGNSMTGNQAFQRIAVIVTGVLWAIVSVIGYTKTVLLDDLKTKVTVLETMAPQGAKDHEVLMTLLSDQGRREAMFAESMALMRELKTAIADLNTRYAALQLDMTRLQMQPAPAQWPAR